MEILKLPDIDPHDLDEDAKKDLIQKYLTFKELMNKIEKDDEEVDEDGNVIAQGPRFNAKEVQNFGMPSVSQRSSTITQNGFSSHQSENLPPGIKMQNFNIRIQNVPLSSLPNKYLPDNISNIRTNTNSINAIAAQNVEPIPETGKKLTH